MGNMDGKTAYHDEWECFCNDCEWERVASNNPKFHSAKKHHQETGHTVFIGRVSKWSYGQLGPSILKGKR